MWLALCSRTGERHVLPPQAPIVLMSLPPATPRRTALQESPPAPHWLVPMLNNMAVGVNLQPKLQTAGRPQISTVLKRGKGTQSPPPFPAPLSPASLPVQLYYPRPCSSHHFTIILRWNQIPVSGSFLDWKMLRRSRRGPPRASVTETPSPFCIDHPLVGPSLPFVLLLRICQGAQLEVPVRLEGIRHQAVVGIDLKQGVPALGAFDVFQDLPRRGLPDVQVGVALQVASVDSLVRFDRQLSPSQLLSAIPARTIAISARNGMGTTSSRPHSW